MSELTCGVGDCDQAVVAVLLVRTHRNVYAARKDEKAASAVLHLCRRHCTEPLISTEFLDAGPPPGGWS